MQKNKIKKLCNLQERILGKCLYLYFHNDYKYNQKMIEKELDFMFSNQDRERISDDVFEYSKNKYGKHYRGAHGGVENEQRGLILPYLFPELNNKSPKNVLEIGCCNGEVSVFLAKKYPQHNFTAMDLKIHLTRAQKHVSKNLKFREGYILDQKQNYDILFASSTFMFMFRQELRSFLEKSRGKYKKILISEPFWGNYKISENFYSAHLEKCCWNHNYHKYAKDLGYQIVSYKEHPYDHPISTRADIIQKIVVLKPSLVAVQNEKEDLAVFA